MRDAPANARQPAPLTPLDLLEAKRAGRRIVALTAYDASFARMLDQAGVDLVLVGDSLGMVVQGEANTLAVTVADVLYHCRAVRRGLERAVLMADLPWLSYATVERAVDAAQRLLGEGQAAMVKLEGAGPYLDVVGALSARDVPVCGHLGLTPQSIHKLGGFKVQGRERTAAERLYQDALALEHAGCMALVLECVPAELAARITQALTIPTIGIGAGPCCDGQILVLHDLLGVDTGHRRPRFVRDFLAGRNGIAAALAAYVEAVRNGTFPSPDESYRT